MKMGWNRTIIAAGIVAVLIGLGLSACNQSTMPATAVAAPIPFTPTHTPTVAPSSTPVTLLVTPTITLTPTITQTPTVTLTPTITMTPAFSYTPSSTPTPTNSPTVTSTLTATTTWTPCVNAGSFGVSISTGTTTVGEANSGYYYAVYYNFPSGPSGTLRDIQAYTTQTSPMILQAAIYGINEIEPTDPGSLLGQSAALTITGPGWFVFDIPGSVALSSGQPYWLCLNNPPGPGSPVGNGFQTNGVTSSGLYIDNNSTTGTGFPGTWPYAQDQDNSGYALPIYADFCE
jgi:hypothetical protein